MKSYWGVLGYDLDGRGQAVMLAASDKTGRQGLAEMRIFAEANRRPTSEGDSMALLLVQALSPIKIQKGWTR